MRVRNSFASLMRGLAVIAALPLLLTGQNPGDAGRGVARLSLMSGDVSIQRGDSGDHVAAALNAPLVTHDRVYTGANSRAELQFDAANFVRLASHTELRLTELLNRRYQIQLAEGTVTFAVVRDTDADVEISTPTVAVRPMRRGNYRVFVRPDGSTEITVRRGEAEIFTPTGAERLRGGEIMRVRGTRANPEFQVARAPGEDEWDRWNRNRDSALERAVGYRYVSRDIYGIEDLDDWGRWVTYPDYGWVWVPRVAVGWAPYRLGRWVWLDWWGWSWVSYDPWGWAPYHYGRWFWGTHGWCWWPGGIGMRHAWSPALVAFFGWGPGLHVGIGFGNVGWIPLGPADPFYPWWGRGIYGGFRNRTFIDNSVNIVNNVNIYNTYRNARVNNAITAVEGADFVRGRPGQGMRLSGDQLREARLVRGALPVTPERESLRMSDRTVEAPVRSARAEGSFYSRRQATSLERVPFEQQREGMQQLSRRAAEAMGYGRAGRVEGGGEAAVVQPSSSGYGRSGTVAAREGGEAGAGYGRAGTGRTAQGAEVVTGERGWRVANESGSETGGSRAVVRGGGGSGYGRAGLAAEDRNSGAAQDGWRRFGEPRGAGRETGRAAGPPGVNPGRGGEAGQTRGGPSDEGWRRFGEPRAIERGTAGNEGRSESGYGRAAGAARTGAAEGGADGWRGFGRSRGGERPEARVDAGRPGEAGGWQGRVDRGEGLAREETRDGWQRFDGGGSRIGRATESAERESREQASPRQAVPEGWRNFGGARDSGRPRGDSLEVNRPIVRERQDFGTPPEAQPRSYSGWGGRAVERGDYGGYSGRTIERGDDGGRSVERGGGGFSSWGGRTVERGDDGGYSGRTIERGDYGGRSVERGGGGYSGWGGRTVERGDYGGYSGRTVERGDSGGRSVERGGGGYSGWGGAARGGGYDAPRPSFGGGGFGGASGGSAGPRMSAPGGGGYGGGMRGGGGGDSGGGGARGGGGGGRGR